MSGRGKEKAMRAAVIENGIVTNIIEVESLDFLPGLVDATGANIGDAWDGTAFHAATPVVKVPEVVSMRQARRALLDAGLLANVESAFAGLTGAAGDAARIDWNYATEVRRDSSLVASMSAALGITSAQLDALFVQALTYAA
jgi:hypothetical protein